MMYSVYGKTSRFIELFYFDKMLLVLFLNVTILCKTLQ